MSGVVVGVDIGGTFTDIFVHDEARAVSKTVKVPSTPDDPSRAFVEGLFQAVDDIEAVTTVLHGTTVATNALLENKGARAGLITTRGFADVLEMRRRDRPTTWGLRGSYQPVIERDRRLEVSERVLADGTIREEVDLQQVRQQTQRLLDMGCESVCLFFINAYANAANEQAASEVIRELWPNDYVSVATEIVPEIREFERVSTAALNACLQPLVSRYFDNLQKTLKKRGFAGELLIVQSNGGVMTVDTARQLPVRTALSGPAAGVIAARAISAAVDMPNIVTCDMGGTSFDVSLVANGQSALAAQTSIGFGRVVRTPMIEISTIGAGGGSIARVDADGLLRVGPESAGSDPGPVCYGLGSSMPTVTDANLVLGRINPDRPIGGVLDRLDVDAATAAILEHVGKPLALDAKHAANAILRVANAHMAGAIRLVSIERGHNPRHFAAMPFGGGGALHTGALIKEVGLQAAIVPRYPGITSAIGCVVADMRHDRVQTVNAMLDGLDTDGLNQAMMSTTRELQQTLDAAQSGIEQVEQYYELDMLYAGQSHTVSVTLPNPVKGAAPAYSIEDIASTFDATYQQAYGRLLSGIPRRVVNYRVVVIGKRRSFDATSLGSRAGSDNAVEGELENAAKAEAIATRQVWVDGAEVPVPIYARELLPIGQQIAGPALIEQLDTTIFIDPGLSGCTDQCGNIVIKPLV